MGEKIQKQARKPGKVMAKNRRVPAEVDVSDLAYLAYGDVTVVANDLGLDANYVARVKRLELYNIKVLSALLIKARENKAALV